MDVTPLMNDGFDSEPARRVLNFIQEQKKMFELAAEVKPVHVMDLPQLPEESEALTAEVNRALKQIRVDGAYRQVYNRWLAVP